MFNLCLTLTHQFDHWGISVITDASSRSLTHQVDQRGRRRGDKWVYQTFYPIWKSSWHLRRVLVSSFKIMLSHSWSLTFLSKISNFGLCSYNQVSEPSDNLSSLDILLRITEDCELKIDKCDVADDLQSKYKREYGNCNTALACDYV